MVKKKRQSIIINQNSKYRTPLIRGYSTSLLILFDFHLGSVCQWQKKKKKSYTISFKINSQHFYFLHHINHFLLLFKLKNHYKIKIFTFLYKTFLLFFFFLTSIKYAIVPLLFLRSMTNIALEHFDAKISCPLIQVGV
jgi:hypothetical protein